MCAHIDTHMHVLNDSFMIKSQEYNIKKKNQPKKPVEIYKSLEELKCLLFLYVQYVFQILISASLKD